MPVQGGKVGRKTGQSSTATGSANLDDSVMNVFAFPRAADKK